MSARDDDERHTPVTPAARRREQEAHALDWAAGNLDADSVGELRTRGIRVFEAPGVEADVSVVDLADGRVRRFHQAERQPRHGYFVRYDALERYCLEHGLALQEIEGFVSLLPHGSGEAGDPLRHIGD